jgi:pilus assembly protein CpaB
MRRKRTLLVLLLALISGAVAAFSALRYLQNRPTPLIAASTADTRPVVVAARDVALGQTLTEDDVRVIDWPANSLPSGIATATSEVVGRSVVDDLDTNEPILASKLAEGGLYGMVPLIPEGMRAVSVSVDQVVAVAGYVTPRTRVDVILIMEAPGTSETRSKVILENLQVLAANQVITENEEGQPIVSSVVTVLVTPEQAEKVTLADTQGTLRLALRNTLDLEPHETEGERESRLFNTAGNTPAPRARVGTTSRAPSESIIEMYRGGQRTLVTYGGSR